MDGSLPGGERRGRDQSEALAALRAGVETYLDASFGGHEVDQDGDYVIHRGSARVWVRLVEQADHTFVVIWSVTNLDLPITGELTAFLAAENAGLAFGKFGLNEQASAVQLSHTLLGDFLNREELAVAVGAVADAADEYDDTIKARFGGRIPGELPAFMAQLVTAAEATELERSGQPASGNVQRVRAFFAFRALVVAVGVLVVAYALWGTWWNG